MIFQRDRNRDSLRGKALLIADNLAIKDSAHRERETACRVHTGIVHEFVCALFPKSFGFQLAIGQRFKQRVLQSAPYPTARYMYISKRNSPASCESCKQVAAP